jgi:hypothetical protein
MNPIATVRRAYAALFANLPAFAGVALLWIAASGFVRLSGYVFDGLPLPEGADTELVEIAPDLLAALISLGGNVCLSIVWHRALILGEAANRMFPTTADVVAPYVVRVAAALLVPFALFVALLWRYGDEIETVAGTAVTHFLLPFALILQAPRLLTFPASAVGDASVTFRTSLTLARGHGFALAAGLLACDLPWSAINYGLDGAMYGYGDGSLGEFLLISLSEVVDLARNATWAAFLSFAYLDLVRPAEAAAEQFK